VSSQAKEKENWKLASKDIQRVDDAAVGLAFDVREGQRRFHFKAHLDILPLSCHLRHEYSHSALPADQRMVCRSEKAVWWGSAAIHLDFPTKFGC